MYSNLDDLVQVQVRARGGEVGKGGCRGDSVNHATMGRCGGVAGCDSTVKRMETHYTLHHHPPCCADGLQS